MQPTGPKTFAVTVTHCKDTSHAEKIATAIGRSFSHLPFRVDWREQQFGFSMIVFNASCEAIRAAVSSLLGDAKCVCGEQSFFGASGKALRLDAPRTGEAEV